MKIRDLKIRTQLLTGNLLIIFLIIILSIMAFHQSETIIEKMKGLYEHPYHVGRAARDIKSNCAMIHSFMKNIVFQEDLTSEEIHDIDLKIENLEKETYKYFDIVYDRYLGQKVHIDSAFQVFTDWKIVRDNLIFMKQNDQADQVLLRYNQVNQPYVDNLMRIINIMVEFEGNKAQSFYSEALKESKNLLIRLLVFMCSLIFLILLINYILTRQIFEPLKGLTAAAERYRSGNYESDYLYCSENEFGILSMAFRKMASTFRKEISLKENTADIAFSLKEDNLNSFSESLLVKLMSAMDCQIAALYILDPDQKIYRHFFSIGMQAEKFQSFSSEHPEGEFGMLISEKKIQIIRNIPADTSFSFVTVTGTFRPKEIISVPVLNNNTITAIISLASIKSFDGVSVQWLNDLRPMLTARINAMMNAQKIRDYSELLDKQNKDLGNMNKELSQQTDELREFNIELNAQKKQLDQMNYLKTTFLSNMSHELRTPLNSIIALASVLTRKLKERVSKDEYNYVQIIEKNGKELLALINDVLDLSRIEAGKEVLTITTFSLRELVNNIIENLMPQVQDKELKIDCTIGADLPLLVSDRVKCTHIFQNIIYNAIKFTEKGKVDIEAQLEGNYFVVNVQDTGIGIDPEKISIIFDEFRQADERSSRKFGGTGLGLAIAKKYCDMLGGKIEVRSTVGKGSVFSIHLPVKPANYSGSVEKEEFYDTDLISDVAVSGKIVLVIEDSEAAIIQVCDILQLSGYRTLVARSGQEAFEILSHTIPDVIVLDLMMPAIDGFEVLKRLRSKEATMSVPVLILTAKQVTTEELSVLKKNNISQLIQKGAIRKEELLASIRRMLKPVPKQKQIISKRQKSEKAGILIIEDNPDNILGLKAMLNEKYNLCIAEDGTEGIAKAREILPDLILLDISLPGIDGFEVLSELRKNEGTKNIPVIALTARAMKEDRDRYIQYGFDAFIPKPIDINKLEETIGKFLTSQINDSDPGH